MSVVTRGFAQYDTDEQTIEVVIVPSGLPRFTSLLPCPGGTEDERLESIAAARRSAILDGYVIESERRIRNTAFDRRGEKTTTRFVLRPAKTKAEAARLIEAIQRELDALAASAA